jgi:hypothetical protein
MIIQIKKLKISAKSTLYHLISLIFCSLWFG